MPSTTEAFTPAQVEQLLYEAGRALMALRVPGCWPAGLRSGMPEHRRDPEDLKYAEAEFTPAQPSPKQVSAMDRAFAWIPLLPATTEYELRIRKLVWARCLVSPRTNSPLYSWKRLGKTFGCSDHHAKTLWLRAIDDITVALNRGSVDWGRLAKLPQHGPCRDTLRRIQATVPAQVRRVMEQAA